MQEILYILLPIAAASGWLGARKHYAARLRRSRWRNCGASAATAWIICCATARIKRLN